MRFWPLLGSVVGGPAYMLPLAAPSAAFSLGMPGAKMRYCVDNIGARQRLDQSFWLLGVQRRHNHPFRYSDCTGRLNARYQPERSADLTPHGSEIPFVFGNLD